MNAYVMIREPMFTRHTTVSCTEFCDSALNRRYYVVSERRTDPVAISRLGLIVRHQMFNCKDYFDFSQAEPARRLAREWIYQEALSE